MVRVVVRVAAFSPAAVFLPAAVAALLPAVAAVAFLPAVVMVARVSVRHRPFVAAQPATASLAVAVVFRLHTPVHTPPARVSTLALALVFALDLIFALVLVFAPDGASVEVTARPAKLLVLEQPFCA